MKPPFLGHGTLQTCVFTLVSVLYLLFVLFCRHVILSSNKPRTLFPYLIGGSFNEVGVKLIYKPSFFFRILLTQTDLATS